MEASDAARNGMQKSALHPQNVVDVSVDKMKDTVDNTVDNSILSELRGLNMDTMSPIEALNKLYQYKSALSGE